jgi:carboxypeptidase PM20D1
MVEPAAHNGLVGGSSPSGPTNSASLTPFNPAVESARCFSLEMRKRFRQDSEHDSRLDCEQEEDGMKKGALAGGGLILVLAAIVGGKTLSFGSLAEKEGTAIAVATAPPFDGAASARRLGEAIRFQTVSHQDPAENKIDQWDALQSWLQQSYPLTHRAMTRERVAERTLIYHWVGSDPTAKPLIVMAHQDVVPVTAGTEKDWKYPPFAGSIAENAVWGRGAVDDKGSLVALFEALEALAAQGFKPKRTIWLVSGHDEEVGGGGAKAAAAFLKSRQVQALFTIDEGSAIIDDAPVINGPAILIGVAEKGYATLKVTANAAGGHSSMPPEQIGTINLAKAIIAINDNQFPLEMRPPVSQMVEIFAAQKGGIGKVAVANQWLLGGIVRKQIGESPTGRAMLHTTIAPTMLQGSPKENVLPQSASALINYRIAPWNSSKDVMARAKQSVGSLPVELSWVTEPREPSPISATNSPGWNLIAAVARAEVPGASLAPFLVVAGTDSRNMEPVSDDVYRFAAIRFKTKDTAMIHGTNEHMTLDNLERMIRFYARLILTSAG